MQTSHFLARPFVRCQIFATESFVVFSPHLIFLSPLSPPHELISQNKMLSMSSHAGKLLQRTTWLVYLFASIMTSRTSSMCSCQAFNYVFQESTGAEGWLKHSRNLLFSCSQIFPILYRASLLMNSLISQCLGWRYC